MSLTPQDLKSIKNIVDHSIERAVDEAKQHTAHGFEEVHQKIDNVQSTLNDMNETLQFEATRNDNQDHQIGHMRKMLHAA